MTTLVFISLILSLAIATAEGSAPRRRLAPGDSIIDELSQQLADGIGHPRFTITATYFDSYSNLFTESALEPFEIDVMLTNPSVTESTSFSADGISSPVKSSIKLLVADQNLQDGTHANTFAILVVDETKGTVSGIVQRNKQLVQLEQLSGQPATVSEVIFDPDDDWTCLIDSDDAGTDQEYSDDSHTHRDHDNLRKLVSSIIGQHMEPDIDERSLENRETKLRQLYATDTFPNKWSYQVDLYIEVDGALVNNHDTDTANMPNTIAYVNALVTAISAIYEQEVDTHLNVLHIAKTNIYDGAANLTVALDIMKKQYSSSTWHYTDPVSGQNPDLHHALLYRTPRAGYATVGGVCDSRIGYGVSSGVQGTLANVGTVYWDLVVMAHELGHNFGSRHTHDIAGYNPLVDACGNGQCTSLVTGNQVSTGDASIMSYCNTCPGGVKNMGTTFGGYWYEDKRSDLNNWKNNDGAIPFSQEPKRVPKVLYEYVSSRGSCVKPYLPIDKQTCNVDADCQDGNSCTIDSCNSMQCSNVMQNNCCGNFICEAGESNCSDCGPFKVETPSCSTCVLPYGAMFDVEAVNNVTLTSIEFKIKSGTNTVTIFTASGGYSDKQRNPNAWTTIYSGTFVATTNKIVSVDFEDIQLRAAAIQAFYIASTGQLATLANNNSGPLASDSNIKLLHPTRGVTATQFGSGYSNVISWVGSMSYRLEAPISVREVFSRVHCYSSDNALGSHLLSLDLLKPQTTTPTAVTTPAPITTSPTGIPSKPPSILPTLKLTNLPSNQPVTSQPQITPSAKPTVFPSKIPTVSPSNPPTTGQVSSPSTLSPSRTSAPSSISPIQSPTIVPLTTKPTAAQPSTPEPTKQLSTLNPTSPQPSKHPSTNQPASFSPSSQPSKLPESSKPTISATSSRPTGATSTPTKLSLTPEPSKMPRTVQPFKQLPTIQPITVSPSSQPTKVPVTFKPTSSSPSPPPTTLHPTMSPATPSPTLFYSVDLCFPGCGNFTDIDRNNELEAIVLKYIPCRSKKCDVKVVAASRRCSVCTFSSLNLQRFSTDETDFLMSSAITFEIVSVNPLNEGKVTSNLNSNIEIANNDLSTNDSNFRVNGNYTSATRQPTAKPMATKPTTQKPSKHQTLTSSPTRIPKKTPTHKPIVAKPATQRPTKKRRPTNRPTKRPTKISPTMKPTPQTKYGKSGKSIPNKAGKSTKSERIESFKSHKKQPESDRDDKDEYSLLTKNQNKQIGKLGDEEILIKKEKKQLAEYLDKLNLFNQGKVETSTANATVLQDRAEPKLNKKEKKDLLKEDNSKSCCEVSDEAHVVKQEVQLSKKEKKKVGKIKRKGGR